jgi:hypothetical protein
LQRLTETDFIQLNNRQNYTFNLSNLWGQAIAFRSPRECDGAGSFRIEVVRWLAPQLARFCCPSYHDTSTGKPCGRYGVFPLSVIFVKPNVFCAGPPVIDHPPQRLTDKKRHHEDCA